jgi:Flp pilus assembly protein TadG
MHIRATLRREDGAAAVEFALIVGVLAMLIFGMLQYGLAFFQLQNLRAAAREGARIGAVGATVAEIKQRTTDATFGVLPTSSTALIVERTTNGTTWTSTPVGENPCPPKGEQTTSSQVRVRVDLNNAGLPAGLKDIFVVDIPLMPPISLKGATINGVFRCEGN